MKILEGTVASVPPQGGRKHPHQEFIQIDTTNVCLFVVEHLMELKRLLPIGLVRKRWVLAPKLRARKSKYRRSITTIDAGRLAQIWSYPEFVGRLPVTVTLDALDEDALVRILVEPKNALIKQYQKLLELDGVQLEFKDDALRSVAQMALKRKTGARGLRSIIEEVMCNVMYDVPSRCDVSKCIVTKESILNKDEPILVTSDRTKSKKKEESA